MANANLKRCMTHDIHRVRLYTDPAYRAARQKLKAFVKDYSTISRFKGLPTWIIKIPVVVHVVYDINKANEQNISDEQINSQIETLNEDFAMTNKDINFVKKLSDDFYGYAAGSFVRFELACRDPDCKPTNGITRTSTTMTEFNIVSCETMDFSGMELVKHKEYGHEAWPTDRYLNIWVCNFTVNHNPYTGCAEFPGEFPEVSSRVDGVVLNYMAFGRNKKLPIDGNRGEWNLWPQYNKGRSATHEIGHWLNLYHIAGDCDPPMCDDTDLVEDTPNQYRLHNPCPGLEDGTYSNPNDVLTCAYENYDSRTFEFDYDACECPAFPCVSCGDTPDMFMNFMDYTQDMCKVMFTAGQVLRMESAINGPRRSLLGSDGCIPVTGDTGADLWIRNSPDDIGLEPDKYSQLMYVSDDIWVNSGHPKIVTGHENPVLGEPCQVYVRVRNRRCKTIKKCNLNLYWAKASTTLGWPDPWTGNVTTPEIMGGMIGIKPIGNMGLHESRVISFDWTPPLPVAHSIFGSNTTQFSLLARIVEVGAPNDGMRFPEGNNLWDNVKNNNNIAWKNVELCGKSIDNTWIGQIIIGVPEKPIPDPIIRRYEKADIGKPTTVRLIFRAPGESTGGLSDVLGSVLDWGTINIALGKDLFSAWKKHDGSSEGLVPADDYSVYVVKPKAHIELRLKPQDLHTIKISFKPRDKIREGYYVFPFDVIQEELGPDGFHPVGGQRFFIRTLYRDHPIG